MNQAQILAQVKKMQTDMARAQEELANMVVTGSAAGGRSADKARFGAV